MEIRFKYSVEQRVNIVLTLPYEVSVSSISIIALGFDLLLPFHPMPYYKNFFQISMELYHFCIIFYSEEGEERGGKG